MIVLLCILAVSSLAVWLVIGVRMHFIEGTFPPLNSSSRMEDPFQGWPFVSVIVPGRNEERDVGACLQSLATQDYPNYELIFVDDESTDRTLAIARATLEKHPFARAMAGAPRPTGKWVGKSWALVQGVEAAKGDWLLFIDSDVVHHPLAIRKAVAEVGSGRKRNSTSAGSLHSVQFRASRTGRTERPNHRNAGDRYAARSYPGRAITAIGTVRAIRRQSRQR